MTAAQRCKGADGAERGDDAGEHQVASSNIVSMSSPRAICRAAPEAGQVREMGQSEVAHGGEAVAAHDGRGVEPGDAVHEVRAEQAGGKAGAAFDQDGGEAGGGEGVEGGGEVGESPLPLPLPARGGGTAWESPSSPCGRGLGGGVSGEPTAITRAPSVRRRPPARIGVGAREQPGRRVGRQNPRRGWRPKRGSRRRSGPAGSIGTRPAGMSGQGRRRAPCRCRP